MTTGDNDICADLRKLFPKAWLSGALSSDEVGDLLEVEMRNGPRPTQAVIGIGWTPARTARHIQHSTRALHHAERWPPNSHSWIMSLHHLDQPGADMPVGFVGFRPELPVDEDEPVRLQFGLNLDMIWVAPPLRRCGYGLHLAVHVFRYLHHYPIPREHFGSTLDGLDVTLYRDESLACRWLAQKLATLFNGDQFLTDCAAAEGQRMPTWPVRSVNVEQDDMS